MITRSVKWEQIIPITKQKKKTRRKLNLSVQSKKKTKNTGVEKM